jgi:phosphate transport system protein
MARHTDNQFEVELDELRGKLLAMAGLVERMIADAIDALTRHDSTLAEQTILLDRRVNRAELDIDQLCLMILARRQPVASDLRFVTLALKMVTDIERIGDIVVNVCERVAQLEAAPALTNYDDIARMADIVRGMVRDSIDAFVHGDCDKAEGVLARDDTVDELYHRVFRSLLVLIREKPELVESGVALQSVAKYLERIGDHSTNLAEQVLFLLRGTDLRHKGKLED